MSDMKDLQSWADRYGTPIPKARYQNMLLFGANPEVEDPLLRAGCRHLKVFDDRVEKSLVDTCDWVTGFKTIWNNPDRSYYLMCGVASTPSQRAKAVMKIEHGLRKCKNWAWTNVVAGSANMSPHAKLGKGCLVLDECYVAPKVVLADHSVMLPGAKLYHHSTLGEYSILVGGSTCLGHSEIRSGCRVCGNAVTSPHAKIGPGTTVPALTLGLTAVDAEKGFFSEFGRGPE